MRKRALLLAVLVAAVTSVAVAGATPVQDTWTGEVVERACFVDRGARGPDHAACAQRCFERGGDVGLVTEDGGLVILRPADDAAPFEALKELAGAQARVTGTASEEDGMTIVVVTASEAVD